MALSVLFFTTLCESTIISIKFSIKNEIQVSFILYVFYHNFKKKQDVPHTHQIGRNWEV